MKKFKQALNEKFDTKDLGKMITQDDSSGYLWMGQLTYVRKMLNKFGMKDAKSVATPVDADTRLMKAEDGDKLYSSGDEQGYSDSGWASDLNYRKSMSFINWRCKKQTSVAPFTAEAEYIAFSSFA